MKNSSSNIIFSHLSHPGHVMFFARSQWKHLRASTEVEKMEADTTSETNPNILMLLRRKAQCTSVMSWYGLHSSHLLTFHMAHPITITDDNLSRCPKIIKEVVATSSRLSKVGKECHK